MSCAAVMQGVTPSVAAAIAAASLPTPQYQVQNYIVRLMQGKELQIKDQVGLLQLSVMASRGQGSSPARKPCATQAFLDNLPPSLL